MITYDDFAKLEIKIGTVVTCEKVENADKLLKLEVDFGDPSTGLGLGRRQILSGIAEFYDAETLVGRQFPFLVNLESRIIRGFESQGMILAADHDGQAVLLEPDKELPPGSTVK